MVLGWRRGWFGAFFYPDVGSGFKIKGESKSCRSLISACFIRGVAGCIDMGSLHRKVPTIKGNLFVRLALWACIRCDKQSTSIKHNMRTCSHAQHKLKRQVCIPILTTAYERRPPKPKTSLHRPAQNDPAAPSHPSLSFQ